MSFIESDKRKYHSVRGFYSNDLGEDPDLVNIGQNQERRDRDLKIAKENREKRKNKPLNIENIDQEVKE